MPPKRRGEEEAPEELVFSGEEGAEVALGDEGWPPPRLPAGAILEVALWEFNRHGLRGMVCHEHTKGGCGGRFGWPPRGRGEFLGCEDLAHSGELSSYLTDGAVHLCQDDPCSSLNVHLIHATRVRLWQPVNFDASYLTRTGKSALKKLVEAQRTKKKPPGRSPAKRKATTTAAPDKRRKGGEGDADSAHSRVIPVLSDGEEGNPEEAGNEDGEPPQVSREHLRSILKSAKDRILGGGAGVRRAPAEKDARRGREVASTDSAPRPGLVAGTSLNPVRRMPTPVMALEDTRDDGSKHLMRKLAGKSDAASALLAQAAQVSAQEARQRREKKKSKEKNDAVHQLLTLLKGKGKKKKKKKNKRSATEGQRRVRDIKPDPEEPGGSGSSGSDSSDTDESKDQEAKSDADSELSYEPPLRKRALREPGSVMEMLVKHAQLQLDRGALLETEGAQPSITTGVKISTYFALLIRPYHVAGSPLLRELYALGQAIDLLRMGKLPETADALASRFIAVHTPLTEGSWTTASRLELFPLEPIQSANTATMLEAHKHRRLVMKSQGLPTSLTWWPGTGRGKGTGAGTKGKKGDQKGRGGRGKGKGAKEQSWGAPKGDQNSWRENKEEAPKK